MKTFRGFDGSGRPRIGRWLLAAAVVGGCAAPPPVPGSAAGSSTPTTTPQPGPSSATGAAAATVEVRYRIVRRTTDPGTDGFAATVTAILADPRGWSRAGFRLVEDPAAPYQIVLGEGGDVDRLCHPYDTAGRYSCQNGPVVALNAERWRHATPQWGGDVEGYRRYLVNHEVGHLLGLHHPDPQCPRPGEPAPVMAQQSGDLDGCHTNQWPLEWEIGLAARHERPLAPGYDPSPPRPRPPSAPRTESRARAMSMWSRPTDPGARTHSRDPTWPYAVPQPTLAVVVALRARSFCVCVGLALEGSHGKQRHRIGSP